MGVASSRRWVQPLRIESDLCPFSKMRAVAGGSRMPRRAPYHRLCCSAEEVLRRWLCGGPRRLLARVLLQAAEQNPNTGITYSQCQIATPTCSAWPSGSAVPATPASSPSTTRSDLAMTKATGVIKGDRLTMALITIAVRGKRPRCSGSVDHVLRTSDDQRDRAIAAPVA